MYMYVDKVICKYHWPFDWEIWKTFFGECLCEKKLYKTTVQQIAKYEHNVCVCIIPLPQNWQTVHLF